VSLPDELPFDIVILRGSGNGVVASPVFQIVNHSAFSVRVALRDARVEIADDEGFAVCREAELPEGGNSIFIQMLCGADGTKESAAALSAEDGAEFIYELAGGAAGSLRFEGVVREAGDRAWEETEVRVSLCFEIFAAPSAETPPDLPVAEEAANGEEAEATPEEAAASEEAAPEEAAPDGTAPEEAEETEPEETPPESGAAESPPPASSPTDDPPLPPEGGAPPDAGTSGAETETAQGARPEEGESGEAAGVPAP
jgi:hypothetical protein